MLNIESVRKLVIIRRYYNYIATARTLIGFKIILIDFIYKIKVLIVESYGLDIILLL